MKLLKIGGIYVNQEHIELVIKYKEAPDDNIMCDSSQFYFCLDTKENIKADEEEFKSWQKQFKIRKNFTFVDSDTRMLVGYHFDFERDRHVGLAKINFCDLATHYVCLSKIVSITSPCPGCPSMPDMEYSVITLQSGKKEYVPQKAAQKILKG